MNPEQFLEIISPNKEDPSPFRLGNISSTYTSGRPKVLFDGESADSARTYPCLSSYVPAANDRVVLAFIGHVWTVFGKVDSGVSLVIVPTLSSGWSNFGGSESTIGYYRDSSAIVRFSGTLKNGTDGLLFNLQVGFRPITNKNFIVGVSTDGANYTPAFIQIRPNGDVVKISGTGTVAMIIDVISFRAEQ